MFTNAAFESRVRDLESFAELGGPVLRTHKRLKRLFGSVVWEYHSLDQNSPIHLTFDDGPSAEGTPYVLDVLTKYDVKATFFVTGSQLINEPDLVRQVLAEKHRIGYHGMTHDAWWFRNRHQRELQMNPERIPLLNNNPFKSESHPLLLRAPYGRIDFATLATAKQLNAQIVHWSLSIRDWMANLRTETLARLVYRYTRPGDILLLHDKGPSAKQMAQALDRVIPVWKDLGYTLSPIEPFLNRGNL